MEIRSSLEIHRLSFFMQLRTAMIVPEEILFLSSVNYENRGVTSHRAFTSIRPQWRRCRAIGTRPNIDGLNSLAGLLWALIRASGWRKRRRGLVDPLSYYAGGGRTRAQDATWTLFDMVFGSSIGSVLPVRRKRLSFDTCRTCGAAIRLAAAP